ncbi:hypothetical protein ACROYT_G044526 [Oculina patagonica]
MSSEEMLLKDEEFKEEILSKLNQLRKEGILCDVTLRIEGQDFPAHRCVLSAASPYFRALFTCEFKLIENENNRVELQDIKSTAAKEVLDFIYTGQAMVDSANAQDLLRAADYLIIPSLKSKVATFLENIIDATNCLQLESFGSQLNCESLEKAAIACKLQNFVTVVKSEDFKTLEFEKVKELMSQDEIIVSKEEEVYEAVVTWVKHDLPSRECLFPELLTCVRLFSMSKYSLRAILHTEDLVNKSRNWGHRPGMAKTDITNCFLLSESVWQPLPSMPCPRTRHGAAVCCGQLYVLGGNSQKPMCSFNPKQNKWIIFSDDDDEEEEEAASDDNNEESLGRPHCSVTSYNEELYVIGGDGSFQNRVDKYDPTLDEWAEVTTLSTPRAAHCAVAMANLIYVIAGHDEEVCHKSVESFNPSTGQWLDVADLNNARRFAAAATSNGKIFVAGGYGDMTWQTIEGSCEMFDPGVNEWSLVSSPIVPRAVCGVISFDNHVYLFGGEDTSSKLDIVERYNVLNDKWHYVGTMPEKLSCLQASLLHIPNKYVA